MVIGFKVFGGGFFFRKINGDYGVHCLKEI